MNGTHKNLRKGGTNVEKNVLLIDDEASLRRSVSIGLMQKGYHTEPCENGMKGLQTLENFKKKGVPLECAVVDIRLPDIDGIKLLKVIKFNYPDTPVIIITGHGNEAIAEEVKAQKAEAYLEKPFTIEELTALLEEIPEAAAKKEAAPIEKAVPAQVFSAYALVTVAKNADLMDVYRKLYFHENVLYCDAIRGDSDLILLLQAATMDGVNDVIDTRIKKIKGVEDVTLLTVDAPVFADNVTSIMGSVDRVLAKEKVTENEAAAVGSKRVSSYVLLQIEKEKLEAVYPALYFDDQVVQCDFTRGKYDMVLLMKGASFADIGNTIKNKIKPMDGVLRIKEWPIITLFEA
jgi:CheY-like chemotaxis protein